jgi:hypothetical protein
VKNRARAEALNRAKKRVEKRRYLVEETGQQFLEY